MSDDLAHAQAQYRALAKKLLDGAIPNVDNHDHFLAD
jgi:hypothetical protein